MHSSIDNQFPNRVRRDFIDILAVNTFKSCSHVNISQDELICLVNLLPYGSSILPTIHKNLFGSSFKYAALGRCMKCATTRQNGIGVSGIIFSLPFNQNPPGKQLLPSNIFDGFFLFFVAGILDIVLNTTSLPIPITSLVLSAIPKIILPPLPLAKATTDFIYLILLSGRLSLNSTFLDSPARISSIVIQVPPTKNSPVFKSAKLNLLYSNFLDSKRI